MLIRRRASGLISVAVLAGLTVAGLAACGQQVGPATATDSRDRAAAAASAGQPAERAGKNAGKNAGTDSNGKSKPTVKVGTLDGVPALTDGEGRALYLFEDDEPNKSNCVGECIAAWPALSGKAKAGKGVDKRELGSIDRPDDGKQVTYHGKPLYYFANDKEPGDTFGQGVKGVWYLVDANGNAIGDTTVKLGRLGGKAAVTDGDGRALYVFAEDKPYKSNCVDKLCRTTWPALTGPAEHAEGVDAGKLGTITRPDGTIQVTYFGKPLYYHVRDTRPGDILGNGFKGLWCLVDVNGQAIKE